MKILLNSLIPAAVFILSLGLSSPSHAKASSTNFKVSKDGYPGPCSTDIQLFETSYLTSSIPGSSKPEAIKPRKSKPKSLDKTFLKKIKRFLKKKRKRRKREIFVMKSTSRSNSLV